MQIRKFEIHNSLAQNAKLCLFIILFLAAVVRLWSLSSIPPHLTPDEASLGYNAYSILRTGKDEYGKTLPLIFKSFGDYKPGLYVYLTVPFVALFGLTEFAVRLPGAISGIFAVWLLYKIVLLLFAKQSNRTPYTEHQTLAIFTAFLLAISPWHIHFSRGAWEVNLALTLTLAGIYLFIKDLKKPKKLYWSALFFALTLLAYQGAKLSTAIVVGILVLVYWKDLVPVEKRFLTRSAVLGMLVALPIIISLFQGKTGRLKVFSVFSYPRSQEHVQSILDQGSSRIGDINYYAFHSESLTFIRGIMGRWLNHFSGRFLFFEGDWQNPRHSAPNHGMLLLADLTLLAVGFAGLLRAKGKTSKFIFLWLILAPLPAALSRDQVHAVRALNMVIPLTVISAIGLTGILRWINKIKSNLIHYSYSILLTATIIGAVIYYLDSYFVHLPVHNAKDWLYGYKQAVEETTTVQNNYKKIVFQQSYDQPYIYFLFYQKYNPASYQAKAVLTEGEVDVGLVEKLDNIKFEIVSWPKVAEPGSLIIGDHIAIPPGFSKDEYDLISEIKYPGGVETAFRILQVK